MNKPDPSDLNAAPMAVLLATASTPEAKTLVGRIVDLVTRHEQRKRGRSATAMQSLSRAVEAFVGDLLAYVPRDGSGAFVFRSLDANSFSGTTVAYRQFTATVKALEALQLVETIPGFYAVKEFDWGGGAVSRLKRGRASRFRATPTLLTLASEFGVTAGDCSDHFREPRPDRPIVLKANPKGSGTTRSRARLWRCQTPQRFANWPIRSG